MHGHLRFSPIVSAHLRDLLDLEVRLQKSASAFGVSLKRAPRECYVEIARRPQSCLVRAKKVLLDLAIVLERCIHDKIDAWDDEKFLRLCLRELGVTFPRDFVERLTEGDLVEGYDADRVQVFRNLRFMATSAYSLLEVQTFDWPTLYARSSLITKRIMQDCDEVLWRSNRTVEMTVPEHFIREIRTKGRQVCSVRFRHLAPLYSRPGRPFGILISCQARIVPSAAAAFKLDFL